MPFSKKGPGGGDDRASTVGGKSYRKQLWDENGDWLPNEPESFKALNKLLARPLSHLWQDTPEHRQRQGKQRWEPLVSEYREASGSKPLTRPATKLLSTQPPKDEEELLLAASQFMGMADYDSEEETESGGVGGQGAGLAAAGAGSGADAGNAGNGAKRSGPPPPSSMAAILQSEFSSDIAKPTLSTASLGPANRPSTALREKGRVGLTVLQAHPEAIAATLARKQAESSHLDAFGGVGMDISDPPAGGEGQGDGARALPLKVCLGPKRPRQVISFEDRIIIDNDASRPTLTMFEHVEGSKVSDGLFPSYILPNGKRAHMYYNGGMLLDEVSVEAVIPPPRPSTVPQALQQTMPLANVLNLIAKPPGSAPPFIPYKPVPRLVPLPSMHTLTVKRPDQLAAEAFGDLREDNLQLVIQAKKIIKTQTTTRVENIEVKPQEEREPWTLPSSIFKNRVKECDARAFFDSHQVRGDESV